MLTHISKDNIITQRTIHIQEMYKTQKSKSLFRHSIFHSAASIWLKVHLKHTVMSSVHVNGPKHKPLCSLFFFSLQTAESSEHLIFEILLAFLFDLWYLYVLTISKPLQKNTLKCQALKMSLLFSFSCAAWIILALSKYIL